MATTFTPRYNLVKPDIGGEPDMWGVLLNGNFDILDDVIFQAATGKLPLTGGTVTGALTVNGKLSCGSGFSANTGTVQTLSSGDQDVVNLRVSGQFSAVNLSMVNLTAIGIAGQSATFALDVAARSFIQSSDARLKHDVKPLDVKPTLADKVTLVTFLWNASNAPDVGVIAQEVQKIAPEYVRQNPDTGYLAVDYAKLALECVIGLAARVRVLESR